MSTSFTITDAAEITALQPYLAREEQKDAVEAAHRQREAARRRGMAGAPLEVVTERSAAERLRAAQAALAKRHEWEKSPRGRLRTALSGLSRSGYPSVAERCISAYSRGVATCIVHAELVFILRELTSVGGDAGTASQYARQACDAAIELAFAPFDQEAA